MRSSHALRVDEWETQETLRQRVVELEREVEEQKRLIAELRASERRRSSATEERRCMVAAMECSTDFIGIASLEGRGVFINTAGRKMIGIKDASEVPGLVMSDCVMPEYIPWLEQTLIPVLMTKGCWEGEILFRHIPSGTPIPVYYSAFLVRDEETGQPIAMATVTRDLRAAKQAEAERKLLHEEQARAIVALRKGEARIEHLDEERQRLVATIECSPDFIGLATLEGAPLYVNKGGRELLGIESAEAVRRSRITDYFMPEDVGFVEREIMPSIRAIGRWEGEFQLKHFKTHEVIPVFYKLFVLHDEVTGQPIGLGTVTHDLRASKRAEAERRALQDEIIRTQAAALAELSTPLVPISDDIVVMPLVGAMDRARAQRVIETLLEGVCKRSAKVAILDITGVAKVDAAVAEALVQAAKGVRMLGARVMLTGIRPDVAHALMQIGVDLSGITTRSTLQGGIAAAMRRA